MFIPNQKMRRLVLAIALGCPAAALAANYTLTGGDGGYGGSGGSGGNEGDGGNSGGAGGQGDGSVYTKQPATNGGAGGSGGAEHQGGTSGSQGVPGSGTAAGAGAGGAAGVPGSTNPRTNAGGGGGGAGGGGSGGASDIASVSDPQAGAITLTGGAGGSGGLGGGGGSSAGGGKTPPPAGNTCSSNDCGGGNGGSGGSGGGGGTAGLVVSDAPAVGDISLTAGHGGQGGTGGAGGADSDIWVGSGGHGAAGGSGGDGGSVALTISAGRTGDIDLSAGDGGNGGSGGNGANADGTGAQGQDHGGDGGAGGSAGRGGDAVLVLEARRVETGDITLRSGTNGGSGNTGSTGSGSNSGIGGNGGAAGQGGLGGSVGFDANTLVTPSLTLTRNDAALRVHVQRLDVTTGDTVLDTNDTEESEVRFDTIALGQGRVFDVSSAEASSYAFDTLEVHAHSATAQIEGDFDLSDREISFRPVPTLNEGVPMLNVDGVLDVSGTRVVTPTAIGLQGGRNHRGELVLLTADTLYGTPANEGGLYRGVQGVSVGYNYILNTQAGTNGNMALRMTSAQATPQAKALSEGYLGGALFLGQGSTLLADSGIRLALSSVGVARRSGKVGVAAFGTISGTSLRYDSGSSIDVEGASFLLGVAADGRIGQGTFTGAAFAEYGVGSFDTSNHFGASGQLWSLGGGAKVKGSGDASYTGGGLLAHYAMDAGYYAEASARAGNSETTFRSNDLVDYLGRRAKYTARPAYLGLHAGLGKTWKFGQQHLLDLHAKYFWLRQDGDHANLSTGDRIHFDAVEFERLRLGLRLAHTLSTVWSAYAGLGYEQEFGGEAKATARTVAGRYTIDAPDVSGGSGLAEIGLSARQGKGFPVGLEVSLQGYGGQLRGVIGNARMNYTF